MLLGIIINEGNKIYIKSNDKKSISLDKVDNNSITHLNKEQAKELFDKIFNTKKQILEKNDQYEIYIDENNFKRYYKNGKEDFNMFYLNNGKDATMYLEKGKILKPASKAFAFLLGGISSTIMITSAGAQVLGDYSSGTSDITVTVDTDTDYYEPVTLETLKNYIYTSDDLTEYDKEMIYNEDYLSFILSNSNNERKLYDLNDRFKDINIKEYEASEYPGANGYYTYGTNTIHILDENANDKEQRKDIVTHEFVHLTQAQFTYSYLAEALAEIMSQEFYGAPNYAYTEVVKRVKVLMEIIGPQQIINGVYSYDTSMFENSIKQYLNEKEANEFLELMQFYDWTNEDKTRENEIHKRVEKLLEKMIENKYKQTHDEKEYYMNKSIMSKILNGELTNRLYFNNKKSEFYDSYTTSDDSEITTNSSHNKSFILSVGSPKEITMNGIVYPKEDFVKSTNYNDVIQILKTNGTVNLHKEKKETRFTVRDCTYKYIGNNQYEKIIYDDEGNEKSIIKIYGDSNLIKDALENCKEQDIIECYCIGNITKEWNEFVSQSSIKLENLYATIIYDDYLSVEINPWGSKTIKKGKIQLPSIEEKFVQNTNQKIKQKSKYKYINIAAEEIINYEFNEKEINHFEEANIIKCLMEIIGPQPILKMVNSNDTKSFEKEIRQYLSKEEAEEFLQLMMNDNWSYILESPVAPGGNMTEKEINNRRAEELISHLAENKYGHLEYSKYHDILCEIKNGIDGRYYFNTQKQEYYEKTQISNGYTDFREYDEKYIESFGQPYQVQIDSVNYSQEDFNEMLKKPGFDKFASQFSSISIILFKDGILFSKININRDNLCNIIDDAQIEIDKEKKELKKEGVSDETIESIYSDFKISLTIHDNDSGKQNKPIYLSWEEYKSNPYIIKKQWSGHVTFYDLKPTIAVSYNELWHKDNKIPSIYELYGGAYPTYTEYVEGKNKIK